jgi:16S rRNA G1207 methylase RsmC
LGRGRIEGVTGEHYFTTNPQVAVAPTHVSFDLAGRTYRLTGGAGVFSADRLDPGTAVLLRTADLPGPRTGGALLDLGCGYGPIACVLATVAPQASVYAVDVNTRALALTRQNAEALDLRLNVLSPDDVPPGLRFREIWSNPPIRVGKAELHALLNRWLPRLEPDGTAWLVVARHLGGDSLAAWLVEQGWNVRRHASKQGFRVLNVTANSGDGRAPEPENL